MSLEARLLKRLGQQREAGLLRQQRVHLPQVLSFSSSDYLGLARDTEVADAYSAGVQQYGFGAGASHLVSGYTQAHQALEEAFAQYLGRERALFFNTGYMANLGVMQALLGRQDVVYQDKLNHASLIDAAKLCGATLKRYRHGDVSHLADLMEQQSSGYGYLVTERVFSMRGDFAPLAELVQLSQIYNLTLMVDDAHGTGLFDFPFSQTEVPVLICPLSKAFGGVGAVVAGSAVLIESLIQFARTYMYTTALPPSIACGLLKSLELVQREPQRRQKLFNNINYFKKTAAACGLMFEPSSHPMQMMTIADSAKMVHIQQALLQKGFLVAGVRPPTVPVGQSCLGIILNSTHEKAEMDALLSALQEEHESHSAQL